MAAAIRLLEATFVQAESLARIGSSEPVGSGSLQPDQLVGLCADEIGIATAMYITGQEEIDALANVIKANALFRYGVGERVRPIRKMRHASFFGCRHFAHNYTEWDQVLMGAPGNEPLQHAARCQIPSQLLKGHVRPFA